MKINVEIFQIIGVIFVHTLTHMGLKTPKKATFN